MALWRIPFAVNGTEEQEVLHDAALARHANFSTGASQTGISGVTSLRVSAGATPGPFVEVGPGSGVITYAQGRVNRQDRAYASYKDQSVPVRNDALTQVPIEPTTSAGGRVDLVCIEVVDPEAEGTSSTTDFSTHEFVRFVVIEGVGSTVQHPHQLPVLERPILPLARVHMPPSESQVRPEMITDVRHMAYVNSDPKPIIGDANTSGNYIHIEPSESDWKTVHTFSNLTVPVWATRVHLSMRLGPMWCVLGDEARGMFRLVGTGQNDPTPGEEFAFVAHGSDRVYAEAVATQSVSWRTAGSTASVALQVRRWTSSPGDGRLVLAGGGASPLMASGWITYEEAPRFDTEAGF